MLPSDLGPFFLRKAVRHIFYRPHIADSFLRQEYRSFQRGQKLKPSRHPFLRGKPLAPVFLAYVVNLGKLFSKFVMFMRNNIVKQNLIHTTPPYQ